MTLAACWLGLKVVLASSLWLRSSCTHALSLPSNDSCWKTVAPIAGGPRQEHAVATIDHDVYIVGGFNGITATKLVQKYNTMTNTWSNAGQLPIAVHHANIAAVDGELYMLGSLQNGVSNGKAWPPLSNTYKYSPTSNSWTEIGIMPDARGSSVLGVHGHVIYIAGGLAGMGNAVDTVSSFDTRTKQWTTDRIAQLPEKRDHAGGGVVGNMMYVIGGRMGSVGSLRDNVWAYNLSDAKGQWAQMTKMPTSRGGAAVAIRDAEIYVFGGEGNPDANSQGVFSAVESFNTSNGMWTVHARMNTPRHGNGAVTVNDSIFIPGGGLQQSGGNPTSLADAYQPESCT